MQQGNKNLKFLIIIPAYNEEQSIEDCLLSLVNQTKTPEKIILVNDSSTDRTGDIVKSLSSRHKLITYKEHKSDAVHRPGSKVINAFNFGLKGENTDGYDIICKYDADLVFPIHYLETVEKAFVNNTRLGLCGGVCSVEKDGQWEIENMTNPDHVRGALKAYRTKAFKGIGGLANQMGWDTADEFKLRYSGWEIAVDSSLEVKQTKPTAVSYKTTYFKKQGEVFYALRYDLLLLFIAALKIALNRKNIRGFFMISNGYVKARKSKLAYLLTQEEGKYLRAYRYKGIKRKLFK